MAARTRTRPPRAPNPKAATAAITSMFDGMGKGATVKVDTSQSGDDWHVHWSPTVLYPQLESGKTFRYSDEKNFLTPVVDRDGQPILSWQTDGLLPPQRRIDDSAQPINRARALSLSPQLARNG